MTNVARHAQPDLLRLPKVCTFHANNKNSNLHIKLLPCTQLSTASQSNFRQSAPLWAEDKPK
ncbi:hypothetical protein AAKU67_001987 [Oxalobacteraceae bacterium GrIS 2.11]